MIHIGSMRGPAVYILDGKVIDHVPTARGTVSIERHCRLELREGESEVSETSATVARARIRGIRSGGAHGPVEAFVAEQLRDPVFAAEWKQHLRARLDQARSTPALPLP